jgi:hypothetical protein
MRLQPGLLAAALVWLARQSFGGGPTASPPSAASAAFARVVFRAYDPDLTLHTFFRSSEGAHYGRRQLAPGGSDR